MAPLKTWAPYERLTAVDLNSAFAEVAAGRMPGCFAPAGAALALVAGQSLELPPGAPVAGGDQGGYWNAPTSRFVIPAGLGGLHLFVASVQAAAGGVKGDLAIMFSQGIGMASSYVQFGRIPSRTTGTTLAVVGNVAAGATAYCMLWSETAGTFTMMQMSIFRLASFGPYAGTTDYGDPLITEDPPLEL